MNPGSLHENFNSQAYTALNFNMSMNKLKNCLLDGSALPVPSELLYLLGYEEIKKTDSEFSSYLC